MIFVKQRSGVRMMILQLEAIERNRLGLVVGHSQYDGMAWQDQQQVYEDFRRGFIK